jgi:hypothetical protein
MRLLFPTLLAVLSLIAGESKAQPFTGVATRCIAYPNGANGVPWHIQNGQNSQNQCFALAGKCTNNPNVPAWYGSSAIVLSPPYRICTLLCLPGPNC